MKCFFVKEIRIIPDTPEEIGITLKLIQNTINKNPTMCGI